MINRRDVLCRLGPLALALPYSVPVTAATTTSLDLQKDFGCVGDGSDEQERLVGAISAARTLGAQLRAGAKRFGHSDVIDFGNVSIIGQGSDKTEFVALTPGRSALIIGGNGACAAGFRTTSPHATKRLLNDESAGLLARNANQFNVHDVHAIGAASVGHMYRGCTDGAITDANASYTLADGIHITGGCERLHCISPTATHTGDDGVAIVSYVKDGKLCQDITVVGATAIDTVRGITVVGGRRIRHLSPITKLTRYCAVYLMGEVSYNTYGLEDVVVFDADIQAPNQKRNSHCSVMIGGRDGMAQAGAEEVSLRAVRCGIVRLKVRADGRTDARAAIGLDPGSEDCFVKNAYISDFGGTDVPAVMVGGSGALLTDVHVDTMSGGFVACAPTASGQFYGEQLSARNICAASRLNRLFDFGGAPHITSISIKHVAITNPPGRPVVSVFSWLGPDEVSIADFVVRQK